MSQSGRNWVNWLRKFLKEDLRTIIIFLVLTLTITWFFVAGLGWLAADGSFVNTPSQNALQKGNRADSDGDTLSDVIEEGCEQGEPVYDSDTGERIGTCTGTDADDKDSDNDFLTDPVEDAVGTDPNNFWSPGWLYIVWIVFGIAFALDYYIKGDPLKQYEEIEGSSSAGVAGKGKGKFAYGSSAFGKKASEMSDEERKEAIQSDARFQKLTQESSPEDAPKPKKRKINYKKLAIRGIIAIIISGIIAFVGAFL